ncbi:MAG: hypothetical protein SFU20_13245 [Chitinophagaceae bacterium]|nr:hypothetical protein [Chitinophagaceae bacterium]
MRKIALFLTALLMGGFVFSQQAYESKVEYLKKAQETFAIDFPYPPSVVEAALVEKLEKMGFKAKESKGFRVYKGAIIQSISGESLDYVFRVEKKSKREKDESVIFMMINKADANMMGMLDSDVKTQAKTFLNDLSPFMEAYNLEVEIAKQVEEVAKAEKKLRKLEDDGSDLQKKLKKLESDIEENKRNQESQSQEIENQKQVLEAMKGKRKG